MALITVRALGANNEPQMGQGQGNFLSDADAVAQIIRTRLLLLEGEWWENLDEGLPLWQNILTYGANNLAALDLFIQDRISGAPYVTRVSNVQSSIVNRRLSYSATVQTDFGPITITNVPQPSSGALP